MVYAGGATEAQPQWSGAIRSSDYLTQRRASSREPIIIDDGFGGWATVSSVCAAVDAGAQSIVVITAGSGFAASIPPESRLQLMERIRGVDLRVISHASVLSVHHGVSVTVSFNESSRTAVFEGDLVIEVGERVASSIATSEANAWVLSIGDAVVPRLVSHAIAEGRSCGQRIASYPQSMMRDVAGGHASARASHGTDS